MKFLLLLVVLGACTKTDSTPEMALTEFIKTRESVKTRVTGRLLQKIQSMTPAEFERFSDTRDLSSESLSIVGKTCQVKTCRLTYQMSYKTQEQFLTQVEKVAELVEVEGRWLISDVRNVSTVHESLEPLNPLQ